MVYAAEVLEVLARDLMITAKSLPPGLRATFDSILGPPQEWDDGPESLSEHAHFRKLIEQRREALILAELGSPGGFWRAVKLIDRLRARFLPLPFFSERPCSIRQHAPDRFPNEAWFFVNGIATDKEMLQLNGRYLSRLFQRPIELIYNPTEGPFADILECIMSRTFDFVSEPAEYTLERISIALSNPAKQRVILLGHSQGGIIVANVVGGLIQRFSGDKERLGKLEVYTFASAGYDIQVDPEIDTPTRRVPYIEHFANTGDIIAKLGVLERQHSINGRVFTLDKQGHFLNAHYLAEIEAAKPYTRRDEDGKRHDDARLYEYRDGGIPELLPIRSAPAPERADQLGAALKQVVVGLS